MLEWKFHVENLEKHRVSTEEVEQAFVDRYAWNVKSVSGSYLLWGKTGDGRLLEIAYRKVRGDLIFVFHAMDARSSHCKLYKRKRS